MNAAIQIAIALGSIVVLLGLMFSVRRFALYKGLAPEVQRKLVHIGTGLYALTLPWIFWDTWPIYLLVGLTLVVMLFLRLPKMASEGLGSTLHAVGRTSYGDIFLAIAVGLCLFLAGDNLYLYVLPIAILTLADAAAALAGTTYGTRFFTVEDGAKSVEGSIVFFSVTLILSVFCLLLMTNLAAPNIVVLSLMVSGFGTLVEAASWRGFDNLFLPVGVLIFLSVHADSSLFELLGLAVLFAASYVGFRLVAPSLGLSRHAALVYVLAVFLILAVTAYQNAIAPILVLLAHAWTRYSSPCSARFPDLDIVAAVALVSFGWLTLGLVTDLNALSFYGISMAAMSMGLIMIALGPSTFPVKLAASVFGFLAFLVLHLWSAGLNAPTVSWAHPMTPVFSATFTMIIVVSWLMPNAFQAARVTKITLLCNAVPLGAYLLSVASQWEKI